MGQYQSGQTVLVTVTSTVGFVFGMIGMLWSFVPIVGGLAFYISIPSAIISGVSVLIAVLQRSRRTFPIVALTISILGIVVSGYQYYAVKSFAEQTSKEMWQIRNQNTKQSSNTGEVEANSYRIIDPSRK